MRTAQGDWLAETIRSGAYFSECERYRYGLWRNVDLALAESYRPDDSTVAFIMLNPSTGDATEDDPTIRRCLGYAKRWGFPKLAVGNLYAFRATDPAELEEPYDPVGPENDDWLGIITGGASLVVCAWGANLGPKPIRAAMRKRLGLNFALGLTAMGHPRHPLYMPAAIDCDDLVPLV